MLVARVQRQSEEMFLRRRAPARREFQCEGRTEIAASLRMNESPARIETVPAPRLDREDIDPEILVCRDALALGPFEIGVEKKAPVVIGVERQLCHEIILKLVSEAPV